MVSYCFFLNTKSAWYSVTQCTGTASISYFGKLLGYVIAPVSFVKFPHTPSRKIIGSVILVIFSRPDFSTSRLFHSLLLTPQYPPCLLHNKKSQFFISLHDIMVLNSLIVQAKASYHHSYYVKTGHLEELKPPSWELGAKCNVN